MTKGEFPASDTTRRQSVVPLFCWTGLLSPLLWAVLLMSFFLALLLPNEVAQSNVFAQTFSTTVRETLLAVSPYADINAHARTTAFASAALLSHAFMWVAITLLFIFNTAASVMNWRHWAEWFNSANARGTRKIRSLDLLVGIVVLVTAPIVFSMVPGSSSIVGKTDLSSRLVFALITVAIIFLWQVLTYVWLPLVHRLLKHQ